MSDKYTRHQEIAREQARQQLQNCALLCAYVYGQPGGWYAIVKGSIDGFAADYAMVHSNPGDFAVHPVRALFTESEAEKVEYAEGLAEIQQAVQEEHRMAEPPPVAVLTPEEIAAATAAVREALDEAEVEDAVEWLRDLCDNTSSDLTMTDWDAVVEAVKK